MGLLIHRAGKLVGKLVLASLIQWVSLASLCMYPRRSTSKMLFVLSPMSSMLLDVVFSNYDMVIFAWRPTLALAMRAIVFSGNLVSSYYTLVGRNLITWQSQM